MNNNKQTVILLIILYYCRDIATACLWSLNNAYLQAYNKIYNTMFFLRMTVTILNNQSEFMATKICNYVLPDSKLYTDAHT